MEKYYIIRGLQEQGYWDQDSKDFGGMLYATKALMKESLYDKKILGEAAKESMFVVEVVEVYNL